MNDKCVVYLSGTGYKISTVFGKILYKDQSFAHLRDAMIFADSEGLDYFVA